MRVGFRFSVPRWTIKYTKGVTVTKRAVRHTVVSSGLETFRHVKGW